MSDKVPGCPKYLRILHDGSVIRCDNLDPAWSATPPADLAVYRIDAATKVWPVPVTYSVELFDDDRKGDNPRWRVCAGPSNVLDEIERAFDSRCSTHKLLSRRIIDSNNKVIREYEPPVPVRYWVDRVYDNGTVEAVSGAYCHENARNLARGLCERNGGTLIARDSTGKTIATYRREVVEVKGG